MADGKETLQSDDYFAGRWQASQPCRLKTISKKQAVETASSHHNKTPDTPE